jgi:hypothetical protein
VIIKHLILHTITYCYGLTLATTVITVVILGTRNSLRYKAYLLHWNPLDHSIMIQVQCNYSDPCSLRPIILYRGNELHHGLCYGCVWVICLRYLINLYSALNLIFRTLVYVHLIPRKQPFCIMSHNPSHIRNNITFFRISKDNFLLARSVSSINF